MQTPIFSAQLSYLVFNPYWNIPKSILTQEILPLLEKDPEYLQKNNMEIVSRFAHNAPVYAINEVNIQRLYNGQLHLRQRPGRKNALGHIRFIFPNSHNIYLHDTPAHSLFKRSKRDFSHVAFVSKSQIHSHSSYYAISQNGMRQRSAKY
ncbi:L,D-transpeptidase family protein [Bathymodiolus japonicus methanotrophic gill symbiont]|uniref:L,D-transpeptidase family protein n=1 Tax=Bathymodiolus japonicus methanotrophic gill symbiont TaxID=113269 RepID=UPI001C8E7B78|nr:L,D-transpeptidase family protein [Bathymodiolus japonicus methanotrophic gill symbiont]